MNTSSNCSFCEIASGGRDVKVVLESNDYLCFLDNHPVNDGHALVIPKHHIQYLEQASDPLLFEFLRDALAEINQRFNPDSTNIGLNNGPEAGQTVPHLHWHIIPRYEGAMDDPAGGVRGVIPEEQKYR